MKGSRGSVSDVEGSAGLDGHLDNFTINNFAWKDVKVDLIKNGKPKSIILDVDGVAKAGTQMRNSLTMTSPLMSIQARSWQSWVHQAAGKICLLYGGLCGKRAEHFMSCSTSTPRQLLEHLNMNAEALVQHRKTTLLNVLARRKGSKALEVNGALNVNGSRASTSSFQAISSYVEQEDALIGSLTVRETLDFAARLSLPR